MTPQEQIEELAGKYDNLEAAYYAHEKSVTSWPGKRVARIRARDAHQVAVNLRSIRFDSPQISEGDDLRKAVERVIDGLHSYSAQFCTGKVAEFMYEQAGELEAALNQKGDSNG